MSQIQDPSIGQDVHHCVPFRKKHGLEFRLLLEIPRQHLLTNAKVRWFGMARTVVLLFSQGLGVPVMLFCNMDVTVRGVHTG